MSKPYFASVNANGYLVYSDANSPKDHFNAVEYQGMSEDLQEKMRETWSGVENINVTALTFSNVFEASDYCVKHGFIVL